MDKLFVQVERVEDLKGRADNYFGFDLCGKDAADATVFSYAKKCKPITNADRIRSMTDEELAEYLDGICHDLWQMFVKDPQKMWLDWLKEASDA